MFPFSTCGQKEKALPQERIDSSFSILEFQKFSTLLRQSAPQCENTCPYSSEITEELYQSIAMIEPQKKKKGGKKLSRKNATASTNSRRQPRRKRAYPYASVRMGRGRPAGSKPAIYVQAGRRPQTRQVRVGGHHHPALRRHPSTGFRRLLRKAPPAR